MTITGRESRCKDVRLKPGPKPLPEGVFTDAALEARLDIANAAGRLAEDGTWPSYAAVAGATGMTTSVVQAHRDALTVARRKWVSIKGEHPHWTDPAQAGQPDAALPEPTVRDSPPASPTPDALEAMLARAVLAERRQERLEEEGKAKTAALAAARRGEAERNDLIARLTLGLRASLPRYTVADAEFGNGS